MKYNLNKYLFWFSVIIIVIVFYYYQKTNQTKSNQTNQSEIIESDFAPSFKEQNSKGEFVEHLDSSTNIYSNFKYKFSMNFPDNWKFDRGAAENTVIRCVEKDSAISVAIIIIELNDVKSNKTIWEIWDANLDNIQEKQYESISKAMNTKIKNYKTRKVYIDNTAAIETKYNLTLKYVDVELEMKTIMYSAYRKPYTYTISISLPQLLYNENPNRYDYLINDFIFVK